MKTMGKASAGALLLVAAAACSGDEFNGVNKDAPVAVAGPDQTVTLGTMVNLNGDQSHDSGGEITDWAWDFGDGSVASGEQVSHFYQGTGVFQVQLTVRDNHNLSSSATTQITVIAGMSGPQPPNPVINAPSTVLISTPFTLDGSKSTDADSTITTWAWALGDGTTAMGAMVQHEYTSTGTMMVTLTVTDENGLSATSLPFPITVTTSVPAGPVAVITGPTTAVIGATVSFSGSSSTDGSGTINSWSWEFGDGTTGTGETVTHEYTSTGMMMVTLTIADTNDATNTSAPWTVTVTSATDNPDGGGAWPNPSKWTYGLNSGVHAHCGGFIAGPLTINLPDPTATTSSITISEGGGVLGATVYTGTFTSATDYFTATNHSTGETQTLEGTFNSSFTEFTGDYVFSSHLVGCSETLAITGTRN